MKETLLAFIIARLEKKGITDLTVSDDSFQDGGFFRFFLRDKDTQYIVTFLEDTEKEILDWYAASHYDDSMDEADRERTRKDYPMEDSVKNYFLQKFEVGGKNWLVRLS